MRDSRADLLRWSTWFLLCTAGLWVLLAARYLAVVALPGGALARGFTALMFLSQAALFAAFAVLLLLPVVLLAARRRWVAPAAFLVALAWLALTVVDGYIWQLYRLHFDASIWNLIVGGAFHETFEFAPVSWLKLGLIVAGLAALLAVCDWIARRMVRRRGAVGVAVAVVLTAIVLLHNGVHAWANASGYTPITGQVRILPFHRPLTAKRWLRRHGLMSQHPVALGEGVGLDYPREPLDCHPLPHPPNMLFVVVDSWRADALRPDVTPNLSQLAAESQRFASHVSGGNATRIGMFSLFYGMPGTYWHDMLGERRGAVL